ncbi:MAG: hypothetical protein ACERJ2_13190 [Filomicrobium sp.]
MFQRNPGGAGILADGQQSRRYGGRLRVLVGGGFEIVFATLVAPVVSFAIAAFAAGLLFGKRIDWSAQERSDRSVSWAEAAVTFGQQTLSGLSVFALLHFFSPVVLPWAMPVIAGFVLSIPFAVWTASKTAGSWSRRYGLCDIPEDHVAPEILASVLQKSRQPGEDDDYNPALNEARSASG